MEALTFGVPYLLIFIETNGYREVSVRKEEAPFTKKKKICVCGNNYRDQQFALPLTLLRSLI